MQRGQVSASCLVQPPEVKPTDEEVKSCIKDDKLLLACGKKIPLLSSACVEPLTGVRSEMPGVKGRVGEKCVDVLRDTGCNGIVVKRDVVSEDQFTGDFNVMLLINNTARKVPIAKIDVDTPYLKGQVEAQCLPYPIYDVVIGNVPGARAAEDPDPSWQDHVQEASIVTTRSQAKKAREIIPLKILSTDESSVVVREKPKQEQYGDESLQKYEERTVKLCEPLKKASDKIQSLSEALTREQVRGVEREEATRHLQDSLDDEQRNLSIVRDALDKEMQLNRQVEEKLSFEKLLKSEVEHELAKTRANLAEVIKAKEALQQELSRDKSLMYETANNLRDREDARQKDEVCNEPKLQLNTLRENCVQRERKQFTVPEILERSERLNRKKDGEVNSFIIEVPTKKICVDEAKAFGAVAVEVDANLCENDVVEGELGVDPVDDVNFMEIGGYVARSLKSQSIYRRPVSSVGRAPVC